jgi:hypothetical protein
MVVALPSSPPARLSRKVWKGPKAKKCYEEKQLEPRSWWRELSYRRTNPTIDDQKWPHAHYL